MTAGLAGKCFPTSSMTDGERAEKIRLFNARSAHWPTKAHCEIAQ
jgi:hypothetical protein